jgi:hypothetical protein
MYFDPEFRVFLGRIILFLHSEWQTYSYSHFLWAKTKIGLYGVPLHPKGHARVQYGLIPINYAMIRAKHSSFDLKVIQPQTW